MGDALPVLDISAATGGWMLLGVTVVLILRAVVMGRWLPKSTHDLIVAEKDRRAEAAEKQARVANEQLSKLLVYAEAADKVLRSLPRGGDADVRPPTS